jgi:hypothetical protein
VETSLFLLIKNHAINATSLIASAAQVIILVDNAHQDTQLIMEAKEAAVISVRSRIVTLV